MTDLADIKAKIASLESGGAEMAAQAKSLLVGDNGWLSRKLIVALIALAAIIWLGPTMGELMKTVEKIVIVYIIVQGAVDVAKLFSNAWVRGKIAEGLAKDGNLTDTEIKTING